MFSYGRMQENTRNVFKKCPLAGYGLKILLLTALIVIIGLSIAISLQTSGSKVDEKPFNSSFTRQDPISQSCPSLESEYLLSKVDFGSSFEGYRQTLTCKSGYKPFPDMIMCVRRGLSLTWSHLPLCYPKHTQIDHFKEIVCRGNQTITSCQMLCLNDYAPIDSQPYSCTNSPCPKVELEREKNEAVCYICDEKCEEISELEPESVNQGLLKLLNCSSKCSNIIISSKGISSHRNSFINGLYNLVGEHEGHLIYKNKASLFYIYNFHSTQWLIGSDFNNSVATFKGVSTSECPEELNDADKYFYDHISNENTWALDPDITFKCFEGDHKVAFTCPCLSYNFYYSLENSSAVPPPESEYNILGDYMLSNDEEKEYQITSQIYKHPIKQQFLLSNDGHFRVWRIQHKNGDTIAIGYTDEHDDSTQLCPDNEGLTWERRNTTSSGERIMVKDPNISVKCSTLFK